VWFAGRRLRIVESVQDGQIVALDRVSVLYLKSGLFVTEHALAAACFECFCVQLIFPAPFVFRESVGEPVLASTFRQ
jgi:hypothetical protein